MSAATHTVSPSALAWVNAPPAPMVLRIHEAAETSRLQPGRKRNAARHMPDLHGHRRVVDHQSLETPPQAHPHARQE